MAYANTWEDAGLYRKFSGLVDSEEILRSNLDLHVHPKFAEITYIINDFSEITGHAVTAAHTGIYAKTDDMVAFVKGRMKIAIVADQDPVVALARGYREQLAGSLFICEIFATLAEARAWVGRDS